MLGPLLEEAMGDRGALPQEIDCACLTHSSASPSRARSQHAVAAAARVQLHPRDTHAVLATAYTNVPPLYACFCALQDVDLNMGPTVYHSLGSSGRPPSRLPYADLIKSRAQYK